VQYNGFIKVQDINSRDLPKDLKKSFYLIEYRNQNKKQIAIVCPLFVKNEYLALHIIIAKVIQPAVDDILALAKYTRQIG
jgi:hypothetical protein